VGDVVSDAPVRWRALGASVAGTSHVAAGRGCDDAHGWWIGAEGEIGVLAVADGAGSRPGTSIVGATAAVRAVVTGAREPSFGAALEADVVGATVSLVRAALGAVAARAEEAGLPVERLATTIGLAVLGRTDVVVAQVGDGLAVIEEPAGTIRSVAVADRSEYANETVFLTSPDALDHVKVHRAPARSVRAVALSTDGLRYKVLDDLRTGVPYTPFFHDAWTFAARAGAGSEAIERFLAGVDDQTGDDKTLLLAVRVPGPPVSADERVPEVAPIERTGAADAGEPAPTGGGAAGAGAVDAGAVDAGESAPADAGGLGDAASLVTGSAP
jgi:hypothetical protein